MWMISNALNIEINTDLTDLRLNCKLYISSNSNSKIPIFADEIHRNKQVNSKYQHCYSKSDIY